MKPFKFNDTNIFLYNLLGNGAEAEYFRKFSPENSSGNRHEKVREEGLLSALHI